MPASRKLIFDIPASLLKISRDSRDYCTLTAERDTAVGLCEIRGMRLTQEDRLEYSTETAAMLAQLPDKMAQRALQSTFDELQTRFVHRYWSGSTACVTTAWIKADGSLCVWNANLGDSAAWLVTFNEETQLTTVTDLNRLHSPDPRINMAEHKRVNATLRPGTSLYVIDNGNTNLSLTRAFGDVDMERAGLSHAVEFQRVVSMTRPKEKYFIVTACDGLTENKNVSPTAIGQLVAAQQQYGLHVIARHLVEAAFNDGFGSRDNISVGVFQVSETPVSVAVFDGHGGDEVSSQLAKHFYPTLKKQIKTAKPDSDPTSLALAAAISKKDWAMLVYNLMSLQHCKTLTPKILRKMNTCRAEITAAFIAMVQQEPNAATKAVIVKDVLDQDNALGVILNTPRYQLFFRHTKREHNQRKVTGSIFKICQALASVIEAIDAERGMEMRKLGCH